MGRGGRLSARIRSRPSPLIGVHMSGASFLPVPPTRKSCNPRPVPKWLHCSEKVQLWAGSLVITSITEYRMLKRTRDCAYDGIMDWVFN
ncbi:hypothetical protein LZ32DRAFT_315742 [Colletotrichum eremochloae]|nr:hypothetical protein LZ32DRAFT_315742 [Colletotrichum eremochloae]